MTFARMMTVALACYMVAHRCDSDGVRKVLALVRSLDDKEEKKWLFFGFLFRHVCCYCYCCLSCCRQEWNVMDCWAV
ncbi:hypothetical protein BGZ63DRAFT_375600 [Mariannaea sp. PMI_226]|nr:hypothetical protein BGZ63DRAFT_375600 [Mariannaea sp. PMI_226]